MRPTVGRAVHFHIPSDQEPRHAVIIRVTPGEDADEIDGSSLEENLARVRLEVTDQEGKHTVHSNVRFSPTPRPGHWTWPPRV